MSVQGDPTEMRAAAARLRTSAESVQAMTSRVDSQMAGLAFTGPAADRVRSEAADRSARARDVVGRLESLALELDRAAEQVEALILDEQRRLAAGS